MTPEQERNERARRKQDVQRVMRSVDTFNTEYILRMRYGEKLMDYRREHARRCRDIEADIWGETEV